MPLDLGCYGNQTSRTPHIDSLAKHGAQLNQLYVASPVCTPSRAAILTGRYPIRSGMDSDHPSSRVVNTPASVGGLPLDEITIAEQLKPHGYATAIVGKWHLGINNGSHAMKWDGYFPIFEQNGDLLPVEQGFDSFFGMPVTNVQACGNKQQHGSQHHIKFLLQRLPLSFTISMLMILITTFLMKITGRFSWPMTVASVFFVGLLFGTAYHITYNYTLLSPSACLLYRNKTLIEQPVQLSSLTERMNEEALGFIEKHQDRPFFLYYAFVKLHTALHTSAAFRNRSGKGDFVDNVEELDWSVGEVLSKLQTLNLLNDTIIVLTSDNGPFLV